jgi:hypothetical protein
MTAARHRMKTNNNNPRTKGRTMSTLIPTPPLRHLVAPTLTDLQAFTAGLDTESLAGLAGELATELGDDPGITAGLDQAKAAESEMATQILGQPLPNGLRPAWTTDPAMMMARRIGVVVAMLRGVEAICPHVSWPPMPSGDRITVWLSARTAVCEREACHAEAYAHWRDDGHCEMCERPSEQFAPVHAPVGGILVSMQVCEECLGLFGDKS